MTVALRLRYMTLSVKINDTAVIVACYEMGPTQSGALGALKIFPAYCSKPQTTSFDIFRDSVESYRTIFSALLWQSTAQHVKTILVEENNG